MEWHPEAGYDCTTPRRPQSRPPWSFQADVVEGAFVLTPFGLHADVEIEIDLRVEELFEVLAGRDADALDQIATLPDHDRLLRLALDHDGAIQREDAVLT